MSLVMVVDDNADMREGLQQHLEDTGYDVLTTPSGEKALVQLKQKKVDVVITDLKMPGIDGLELLAQIRALDPDITVLLMTAHGTVEQAVKAMRLGAFDFLLKPFSMQEMELKLAKAIKVRTLTGQNQWLKEELGRYQGKMTGKSPVMQRVYEAIGKVSPARTTVLITGESGTGKELVAQAIHQASPWNKAPLVQVHCAALAPGILESELFGHEKGAFTGATQRKIGRFELAQGGTLMLDEVSEIPPEIQVKLLRVLQEREFERVGGTQTLRSDSRIIALTNRDLTERVSQGLFREDLYYRLNVVNIHLPPLRDRIEDIAVLASHFIERYCRELGKGPKHLSQTSLKAFEAYGWPGNVRELQNILERALVFSDQDELEVRPEALPGFSTSLSFPEKLQGSLSEILGKTEKNLIRQALKDCKGVQNKAAKKLRLSRSALQYKIRKYRLKEFCRETNP